jgi:hypothetical protein
MPSMNVSYLWRKIRDTNQFQAYNSSYKRDHPNPKAIMTPQFKPLFNRVLNDLPRNT